MSLTADEMNFISQQLNIYFGLFIFITGLTGGLLNIIIFTTLKTFRETSCGFYLTATSIFNVGHVVFALSTRILESGFRINVTTHPWSCKFRTFLAQSCVLLSLTGMSLATIDQFLSMTKYRKWSRLKYARRHIFVACCFWFLHGIFAFLFWDIFNDACSAIGHHYRNYLMHFYLPILLGCLPIMIMVTFALLSFRKIRSLACRRMSIVRLSRDRQLTAMTLIQASFTVLTSIPYTTFNIYLLNTTPTSPESIAYHRLINTVLVLLYYENFAVNINIC